MPYTEEGLRLIQLAKNDPERFKAEIELVAAENPEEFKAMLYVMQPVEKPVEKV